MSQDITWLGNSYQDVPFIQLPKTGGGTAQFDDTTIASNAATAADIASGKLAYVNGLLLTGTGSGGASPWTLINERTVTGVTQTSTTAASVVTIQGGSAISTPDKIVWVHIRDTAGKRAGYCYGSDCFFVNINKSNGSTSTFTTPAVYCLRVTTAGLYATTVGQYGVYGYSITNAGALLVRKRYNSNYSLTIDGDFKISVYTLNLPGGLTLFD